MSNTPWYWRSPLANKMQINALRSTQTAVRQETSFTTTDFTTTNTTDYQTVASTSIFIPKGQVVLFAWTAFQAQHTVANAEFSAQLVLYTDVTLATAYVLGLADHILLPATANKNIAPVVLNLGVNIPTNVPNIQYGSRLLQLRAWNHTAGTLKLPGLTSTIIIHAFLSGDSSR